MNDLAHQTATFVVGEFLPTMAALAMAAGREPLTWGVIALATFVWLRARRA